MQAVLCGVAQWGPRELKPGRFWGAQRAEEAQHASCTCSAAPLFTPLVQVWVDPLTRRRFGSENTYLAHVNSNKYKELVRRSGAEAPLPVIVLRRAEASGALGPAAAAACPSKLERTELYQCFFAVRQDYMERCKKDFPF